MLQYRGHAYSRDQLKYRVARYIKAGLVEAYDPIAMMRGLTYGITSYGLSCLETLGQAMVSFTSESSRLADPIQRVHALGLNDIMLLFCSTGKVVRWLTDRQVRDRNVTSTSPFAKDYDGVCVYTNAENQQLVAAVEYERSMKSRDRYLDIKARISREARINFLIYFVAAQATIPTIASYLGASNPCTVLYVPIGDFRAQGMSARAHYLTPSDGHNKLLPGRLDDILGLRV
jgi:hypothetical protein